MKELLEEGLHRAGASPVHLAIRGTPAADRVRCAWRGIARTAQQREDAIRFWLQIEPTDPIPDVEIVEALFTVVLDTLDPEFRETAKAKFLAEAGHAIGVHGVSVAHAYEDGSSGFEDLAIMEEKVSRNAICSPYPLDVLAMYALYQTRQ